MNDIAAKTIFSRRAFLESAGCCTILSVCGEGRAAAATAAGTQAAAPADYAWPGYTSVPAYRYGFVAGPNPAFTVRADRGGVSRRTIRGYVCFSEGPNRNAALTNAALIRELDRLNADLRIAWETMGFAPDKGFAHGNYINYYLLGSGLEGGDATNPNEVGYQGSEFYGGEWWPCVCTSYHAIVRASGGDALSRANITHETIHVLQSGTGSFTNAGWFHEAHNAHFGARLIDLRDGVKALGYLDCVSTLGPHVPIESFGGWMKDGTFGAPSPEAGISPREFFGGAQYCGMFPLFLALYVGNTVNNWLWKNNQPGETVLQTLARGLGVDQTRRAIMEYRARLALVDLGGWRPALKEQVDGQFGNAANAMYAATHRKGDTLTPAADTLPGISGANYIPLTVKGGGATITFAPGGADMRCQLVYRATDGSAVYGTPVSSGVCTVSLARPPADHVIVAVVTNVSTTHSKTSKFPYTIGLGDGLSPARRTGRYY